MIYTLISRYFDLQEWTILSIDLPGWIGNSENIFENDIYSIDRYSELISDFIIQLGIKNLRLLGYSFGGNLAVRTVNSDTSKYISHLALISPFIDGSLASGTWQYTLFKIAKFINLKSIVRSYVYRRFNLYKNKMLDYGVPELFLKSYLSLIDKANYTIIYKSLFELFDSDITKQVESLNNRDNNIYTIVISSKDEDKYLRKKAEVIRRKLNNEHSAFLHGNHEDFILRPSKSNVLKLIKYLE